MLPTLLRLANRLLWGTITMVLLALALIVSLGRYYMPQLGLYQQQIVSEIRSRVDLEFDVGSIEGEWRGLSPVLRVNNFRLLNPEGDVVVEAGHLAVYFDLLESILHRTVLAQTVSLVDAEVSLGQGSDGRWGLRGIERAANPAIAATLLNFFQQLDLLELGHVQVAAQTQDGDIQAIDSLSLMLRQGLYLSQLSLELAAPRERPSLRLAAEFSGPLDSPGEIEGYLSLDQLDLRLVESFLPNWRQKLPPQLSGEFWLDWRTDEDLEVSGTVLTGDWPLGKLLQREMPDLGALDFDFFLRRQPGGAMSGRLQDLDFKWADAGFRFGEIEFDLVAEQLAVRVDATPLQPLVTGALNSGLLPEPLVNVLQTLQPRGRLRNIHLDIPLRKDQLDALSLRAELADAALESWKGAPGARSIDGYVEAGLKGGYVDLDGSYLLLDFPGLYAQPLEFSGVDARVGWQLGERVLVNSGLIRLRGDFGAGTAQLDLDIPRVPAPGDRPVMSLMIGLEDTDAGYRNRYIPQLLSASLQNWLDTSIEAATVDDLGFIYYGALGKADPMERTVQLYLDARDTRMRYLPDWPLLQDIQAHMVLSDGYLVATAPRATTLNSQVRDVRVELNPRDQVPWINVTGSVDGPAADLIQLFSESPLRALTGGAFASWTATGTYTAGLDLQFPLQPAAGLTPQVLVDGQLLGVQLRNPGLDIDFTDIAGGISYSQSGGVTAERLEGKLWDQPLTASITAGESTTAGNRPLVLRARSKVAVESLQQWRPNPLLGFATGSADVWAEMTIVPAADTSIESSLRIRSELVGVALNLPEPFAKVPGDSRAAQLDLSFARPGYGEWYVSDLASGRVDTGSASLRASVWLGRGEVPPLPAAGVEVAGSVAHADLAQWLQTFTAYESHSINASPGGAPDLSVQGLKIVDFSVFGERVVNPVLDAKVIDGRWQVHIAHPRVEGKLTLPAFNQPLGIEFTRLLLPLDTTAQKLAADPGEGLAAVDPAGLPAASVVLEKFAIGAQDFGRWVFDLAPFEGGAKITGLTIVVNGEVFSGADIARGATLDWTLADGQHTTKLQGMLRAGNLEDLFAHWGYEAGVVSESAQVNMDFRWDGPPDQLALSVIAGDMSLDLRDGQLLQTSGTAADALKLVGILNINNLARRLRLDFSDLFAKGLSYDEIKSSIVLNRGLLTMEEPLIVDGPSSYLKMTGDFDLNGGAIDADLVVGLPITSNLPWVVALALPGGIPIAAGVYVAGKVFEKQLQKLTSAVYKVTGTLDKPKIEFKRLMETGDDSTKADGAG